MKKTYTINDLKTVKPRQRKWVALSCPSIIAELNRLYPNVDLNIQVQCYAVDKSPYCEVCGSPVKLARNTTCSRACRDVQQRSDEVRHDRRTKQKATIIERYGVEHVAHIEGVTERRLKTMMDKYGALVSPHARESTRSRAADMNLKGRQTLMERYGVSNPGQLPGHGDMVRDTHLYTDTEYDALLDPQYTRLEPYMGMSVKILHRHVPCGHEWLVVPGTLLRLPGSCPVCAKYGFSDSDVGHLYLLDVNGVCIKYGITNDIADRQQSLRRLGGSTTTVIRSWQFDSGSHARDIERLVKLKFGGSWAPPELLPNGWTETLDPALRDEVIQFIENTIK